MKKILVVIGVLVALALNTLGCSSSTRKEPTTSEYSSAEIFESDLNDGYNLENITVTFKVKDIKEESIAGYNLWAGEHLNFLPNEAPQTISIGDLVTAKTINIKKRGSSWLIDCEILSIRSSSTSEPTIWRYRNRLFSASSHSD